eukprot:TRINITY_DN64888_c0_g1_i1.p1 TRINITY_DN64888_c0_g1~~TRINITY_DN64888_c0_g1_i1.p1  ORF type:complete len:312 (+),score=52.25 TRINITY_DN64888_c0_g1_i1:47-937(+)
MPSRLRASSCPSQAALQSQADLLRQRGDLRGTSARFQVQLTKPSPAIIHAEPITRLGMEVKPHESRSRLVVEDVDRHPQQRTPVAQWNTSETRQAVRAEGERHQNLAIKPGDRIKAVNDQNSATLMLHELSEAADQADPKVVNLEVSRDISNVLAPSPQRPGSAGGGTPATIPESPATSRPATVNSPAAGRPPRPPRSPCPARLGDERGRNSGSPAPRLRSKDGGSRASSPYQQPARTLAEQWEASIALQQRSATPSLSSPAVPRGRAASVGPFDKRMRSSFSQGVLTSAGRASLR